MQGGKDHERLARFATLFQERSLPTTEKVEADLLQMRVQEGLVEG
jgi:hypothetical protein